MDLEMWKQTKDIAHMVQIIKHGLFYFTLIYAIVMDAAGSY